MRFVDPQKWTRSGVNPGNVWREVRLHDGSTIRVTVFLKYGLYRICLAGQKEEGQYFHQETYASQAEARTTAFELVEQLKAPAEE
jgi:hypothetical protein